MKNKKKFLSQIIDLTKSDYSYTSIEFKTTFDKLAHYVDIHSMVFVWIVYIIWLPVLMYYFISSVECMLTLILVGCQGVFLFIGVRCLRLAYWCSMMEGGLHD